MSLLHWTVIYCDCRDNIQAETDQTDKCLYVAVLMLQVEMIIIEATFHRSNPGHIIDGPLIMGFFHLREWECKKVIPSLQRITLLLIFKALTLSNGTQLLDREFVIEGELVC